ncbi:MAG: DUF4837 family protein [Bacteroidetes bacterium]|nr:DUF4837 family protein [Bacteroidota bacterium]MBL7103767.1 DUF4837 family protein [Bacteroidales bacterium]
MKRFLILTPLFISGLLLLNSCETKKSSVPASSGITAEIIIVTNNQTQWEGAIGDSIRNFFGQEYQVLPQPEPLFELSYIPMANFKNTKMFKSHHNVLIVDIDKKSKKAGLEAKKDFWASPQRVIKITAPSDTAFYKLFDENKEVILKIFGESERERLIKTFKAFRDRSIQDELRKNFHLTLEIPGGFYIAKKYADFIWLRKETEKISQGIIIYSYDYTDTAAFTTQRIISYMDTITKEYIPGPSGGSYMSVSEKYIPPVSKRIDFNGMFAVETRGLWQVEGDFMGGPFVNYTLVDEKRNKVFTLDGYVYAPNAPKRDLLIQMEAILYSLKFVD